MILYMNIQWAHCFQSSPSWTVIYITRPPHIIHLISSLSSKEFDSDSICSSKGAELLSLHPIGAFLKCDVPWLMLRLVTRQSKFYYSEFVRFPFLRFEVGCATFHPYRLCQCTDIAVLRNKKFFFLIFVCNHEFSLSALQLWSSSRMLIGTQRLWVFTINRVGQWTESSSFTI